MHERNQSEAVSTVFPIREGAKNIFAQRCDYPCFCQHFCWLKIAEKTHIESLQLDSFKLVGLVRSCGRYWIETVYFFHIGVDPGYQKFIHIPFYILSSFSPCFIQNVRKWKKKKYSPCPASRSRFFSGSFNENL